MQLTPETLNQLLSNKWRLPWLDFYFYKYDRNDLIIAGSYDFSYYHNIEIIAHQPINIQGNTEWTSYPEMKFISALNISSDPTSNPIKILQFHSDEGIELTLTAESFSYNLDTVFYYKRDNLGANERLAEWVKE